MRFVDISQGTEYAVRLKVAAAEPVLHVVVLDRVLRTKQLKVRHVDGENAGMEEFLPFRHFVAPWKELRRFRKEEAAVAAVRQASGNVDFVSKDAVQFVLESSGEGHLFVHSDGHLSASPTSLERLARRAGVSPSLQDIDGLAFIDRDGQVQASYIGAERLARAFAAAEANTVTLAVEREEGEYVAKGYAPGERWWHEELRKIRPIHALVRQWAGVESELARLNAEIQRLRSLLAMAASDLSAAGDARGAGRIRRALEGR